MVVVKFVVCVSEVVSIFSKNLTWIIGGGQKNTLCPTNSIIGGRVPRLSPLSLRLWTRDLLMRDGRNKFIVHYKDVRRVGVTKQCSGRSGAPAAPAINR